MIHRRLAVVAGLAAALAVTAPASPAAADPPASVTLDGSSRDFRGSGQPVGGAYPATTHPDFESAGGADTAIVTSSLGADGLPVYAPVTTSPTTHGRAAFDQWFRDAEGVNVSVPLSLELIRRPDGSYRFDDQTFFPLDGAGWVALGRERTLLGIDGLAHNFSFTAELHSELLYTGSETISIIGDDDLFLYVNGKLAINLGGVHGAQSGSATLSRRPDLSLAAGRLVDVDLFVAERHSGASTLRVTTPRLGFDAGTAALPPTARSGETVTCTPAGWPADAALAYAWLRDGDEIADAAGPARTLTDADAGRMLTCRVSGSRRTTASARSGALAVAPLEPPVDPPADPPADPPVGPPLLPPVGPPVVVVPLPAPEQPNPPTRTRRPPRVTLQGTTLTAARDGSVRLRIACSPREAAGRGGCRGSVRLNRVARGRDVRTFARASFSAKAGRTATVRMRLTSAARSSLARAPGRRLRLRVAIEARDLAGNRGTLTVARTLRLR